MAGGTFTSQNKIRPGAYINFRSVSKPTITVGDRGVATVALPLSWGDETALIDVYSEDLLTGKSLETIGYTAYDTEDSRLLSSILSGCYLCRVFRLDAGGTKANATIGELTATARYAGKLGNKIHVSLKEEGELFEVETWVNGALKHTQTVAESAELEDNAFVVFNKTGALSANGGTVLSGGADGALVTTRYPEYYGLAKNARWNIMALVSDDISIKESTVEFIKELREKEGRYVQAVIADYNVADYEGIISNKNTIEIGGVEFTKEEITCVIAGLEGGAKITDSLTAWVISKATRIIGELTNTEIEQALLDGYIVFTANQDGAIKIEQDINTLHTFVQDKSKNYRKNRVIRTLDETGASIREIWESSYMGKVNNDAEGRSIFRGDAVGYLSALSDMSAIRDFAGADDVEVLPGEDIDAVVCNIAERPIDSMEKLYCTVTL